MANGYSVGKPYAQVSVDISDVTDGLEEFNVRTKRALRKYLEEDACPQLRSYMKSHHKWQNRTGTAEVSLDAKVIKSGNMKRTDFMLNVELSYSAYNRGFPYGVMLENAYDGKYALFPDTLDKMSPEILEGMRGVVDYYG